VLKRDYMPLFLVSFYLLRRLILGREFKRVSASLTNTAPLPLSKGRGIKGDGVSK
jgi:hypothetical protein